MSDSTILMSSKPDGDFDDYLMHYGIKGMRWGVRKDKDKDKPKSKSKTTIDKTKPNTKIKEEEPAAIGGGGRENTEEEDLRELEAINKVLESGGDMKLKEFTTLLRRKSEIQKRMDARNNPDGEKSSSRKEPKATDKITSEGVSIDKVFNLNSDLTTEERIARGRKRRLEREKRKGSAKHSDLLSVKMKDIASGNHLAHYQAAIDLDDYLMHYGVKGMRWGVRKDRKTGKITSVVKRDRTAKAETDTPIAKAINSNPAMKKSASGVKDIYKHANKSIKRGLRNINNSDKYKNADLTNPKDKKTREYHIEVSEMVNTQLNASSVIKDRGRKDRLVPLFDYNTFGDGKPRIDTFEGGSTNEWKSRSMLRAAKQTHNSTLTLKDKVLSDVNRVAIAGALGDVTGLINGPVDTGIRFASGMAEIGAQGVTSEVGMSNIMLDKMLAPRGLGVLLDKLNHADVTEENLVGVIFRLSNDGMVQDIDFEVLASNPEGLTHDVLTADQDLDGYLMHYGVKGMRWGVRKDGKPQGHQGGGSKSKSKSASDKLKERASKLSSSAKKKIRKATDPKERAKRIIRKQKRKADIAEAKAEANARIAEAEKKAAAARKATETTRTATTAKSGSGSMSDKELKAVVERMNLEKQYAKHMSDAKPKPMSQQILKFAKDTAIDFGKQRLKAEINRNLGNNFDKLFKVAGATTSIPDPTPEPKNPFTFKARKPKDPKPKAPRTETPQSSTPRPQSSPTRPSYTPTRPALMSPPNPSILALPAPKPKGPSSGPSASARMKDNPTVAKFGKVSMDQVQAYKEGRPYKPFDPRRRR